MLNYWVPPVGEVGFTLVPVKPEEESGPDDCEAPRIVAAFGEHAEENL